MLTTLLASCAQSATHDSWVGLPHQPPSALALLVDEGRLDWDMPVRAVLPEFRLRDPVTTEQASLRDLLTHRTGLPRHDGVHVDGHLTMPAYLPR